MTPRTRAKDTSPNDRVYRSENVPQQIHFPGRRKTIRRPTAGANDGSDKRQSTIARGKLKRTTTVADSDDDEDLEIGEHDRSEEEKKMVKQEEDQLSFSKSAKTRGKKRTSDTMEEPEDQDPAIHVQKRSRKSAASTPRSRTQKVKAEINNDDQPRATMKSVERKRDSVKRRRQSTMTQMVDGRIPLSDADEPDFKPVKRSARRSMGRGGKTSQDKKQQTLTQMVPGMTSFEMTSDGDVTEAASDVETMEPSIAHDVHSIPPLEASFDGAADLVRSVEDSNGDDTEVDYYPTQYIEAPSTRTRRMRDRGAAQQGADEGNNKTEKPRRSRILATPKKQRDRIIASSQSPADSPLKTPISNRQRQRSPLSDISGNAPQQVETPSTQKQVAFEEPARKRTIPPVLRKFESTIQDSEDEENELLEWDEPGQSTELNVKYLGQDVGVETQAILHQIDQACASDELIPEASEEESDELPVFSDTARHADYEASPELGEYANSNAHSIKREPGFDNDAMDGIAEPRSPAPYHSEVSHSKYIKKEFEQTQGPTNLASTPPLPAIEPMPRSSPILVKDEDYEDELQSETNPVQISQKQHQQEQLVHMQHSEDLDGHAVQVPRSPPGDHETQQSHSSKAEQQLQHEWCTYSQYVNVRQNYSSSMNVAPDKFSYHATPRPPQQTHSYQAFSHQYSQATTVDEVTPKKNRTYRIPSATTTPRRIASSQPFVSPIKPPPLFIPSSFPSPAKARMEDWSSPVVESVQNTFGNAYGGSIEDFSIPLPPPPPVEDN